MIRSMTLRRHPRSVLARLHAGQSFLPRCCSSSPGRLARDGGQLHHIQYDTAHIAVRRLDDLAPVDQQCAHGGTGRHTSAAPHARISSQASGRSASAGEASTGRFWRCIRARFSAAWRSRLQPCAVQQGRPGFGAGWCCSCCSRSQPQLCLGTIRAGEMPYAGTHCASALSWSCNQSLGRCLTCVKQPVLGLPPHNLSRPEHDHIALAGCDAASGTQAHTKAYTGAWNCAKTVVREEGAWGFTRGLGATLCREVPGNAVFFVVYEVGPGCHCLLGLHAVCACKAGVPADKRQRLDTLLAVP